LQENSMSKPGALAQLMAWRRQVGRTLNLMVGMPDYDTYVAHMKAIPSLRDDLRRILPRAPGSARGKGGGRCC
jgi:uncharacterized short protein YbdD (DUF466 family)